MLTGSGLKFKMKLSRPTQWLLEVAFANIHFIDLYTPSPDGDGFAVKQTGALRSPETRDIRHPHFIFNLSVPPQSQQTVYLRIQSEASIALPLILWEPTTFFNQSQESQLLQALIFGALLSLLIYNLFLLVSLREASYLYLVISLASIIVFDLVYTGYLEIYIFPNIYHLRQYYMKLSFPLVFISIILFTNTFLELKTQLPKLYWLNLAILAVWGVLSLLIPFASYRTTAILMMPWGLFSLAIALIAGSVTWLRGFHPARYFMIAWLGLIITFSLVMLVRLGVAPSSIITENAYRLGWVWMGVFWSLALADRINLLKAATEAANRDLMTSKYQLSQILEGLPLGVVLYGQDQKPKYVNQRTIEILSNPELEIQVDISVGRTMAQAMSYFSMKEAGGDQDYPLERMPVYSALRGESASVDDIEADLVDKRVPLEIWASPILDGAGEVESAVVAFQDITQRKQAEAELVEYRKNLEALVEQRTGELQDAQTQIATLFDSSPLGIGMATIEGTIVGVNQALQHITGYTEEELLNLNIEQLYADPKQRYQVLEHLKASGSLHNYGIKHQRRDGSIYFASLNLSSLKIAGRELLLSVIEDVSEQVEMRNALTALHDISHDLSLMDNLDTLLEHAVGHFHEILDFERATLMLVEEDEISLTLHAYLSPTLPPGLTVNHIPISSQLSIQAALEKGETTYVPDMLAVEAIQADLDTIEIERLASALKLSRSWLSLPLQVGGRKIGLFNLLHGKVNRYTENDLELARTFANQFAIAIDNIRLNEQAKLVAAADERSRLARELHDSVTQTLFTASVLAESAPRIWDKDLGIARQNLDKLSVLIRGALAEMRSLLLELRADELHQQTLDQLLTTLVEGARARTNVAISLTMMDDAQLPGNVILAFYRIAREAVNNAIVHAAANRINISLTKEPDWITLHIQDDGRGFDPQDVSAGHLGINIMVERTAIIGGDLRIQSEPGHGTHIIVTWSDQEGGSGERD